MVVRYARRAVSESDGALAQHRHPAYLLAWEHEPFWIPFLRMLSPIVPQSSLRILFQRLARLAVRIGRLSSYTEKKDLFSPAYVDALADAEKLIKEQPRKVIDFKIGRRSARSLCPLALAGWDEVVRVSSDVIPSDAARQKWWKIGDRAPALSGTSEAPPQFFTTNHDVFSVKTAGRFARLFGGPTTTRGGTPLSKPEREFSDVLLFRDIILPLLVLEFRAYRSERGYLKDSLAGGKTKYPDNMVAVVKNVEETTEFEGGKIEWLKASQLRWGSVVRTVQKLHPHLGWGRSAGGLGEQGDFVHLDFVEGEYGQDADAPWQDYPTGYGLEVRQKGAGEVKQVERLLGLEVLEDLP